MARFKGWTSYVNENGEFTLPRYLYETNNELMKQCLDLGTMAIQDPTRLRAFKETVKSSFRKRWNDLAESLEHFEIVEPCGCTNGTFCTVCGGSRFQLSQALTADKVREVAMFIGKDADPTVAARLQEKMNELENA